MEPLRSSRDTKFHSGGHMAASTANGKVSSMAGCKLPYLKVRFYGRPSWSRKTILASQTVHE